MSRRRSRDSACCGTFHDSSAYANGNTDQLLLLACSVLTFFVSTLIGTIITSGLIATAGVLVRILYYHPNRTDHRKYVADNVDAWLFWAAANLIVSWILGFIIDIIPGILTWIIFLAWGHVNEAVKSRVELYNSVDDTVKPAFYAAAAWVSWVIIFTGIFDLYDMGNEGASRAPYTPRVSLSLTPSINATLN